MARTTPSRQYQSCEKFVTWPAGAGIVAACTTTTLPNPAERSPSFRRKQHGSSRSCPIAFRRSPPMSGRCRLHCRLRPSRSLVIPSLPRRSQGESRPAHPAVHPSRARRRPRVVGMARAPKTPRFRRVGDDAAAGGSRASCLPRARGAAVDRSSALCVRAPQCCHRCSARFRASNLRCPKVCS